MEESIQGTVIIARNLPLERPEDKLGAKSNWEPRSEMVDDEDGTMAQRVNYQKQSGFGS